MTTTDSKTLQAHITRFRERVNERLDGWMPGAHEVPARLHEAMRYAVLNGGKRVRAILTYSAGMATGAEVALLDAPACAVELIHAYSLVHDDMPPMDNDDLRRGKPSCHKAFDEATALLTGDALQSLAFTMLAEHADPGAKRASELLAVLADASGSRGMAGGQAIDLGAVGKRLDLDALQNMHVLKTGALIRASVRLGALSAPQSTQAQLDDLDEYARCIGLAFQIQDDVLDVESDTATLGKQQGADAALNKPTYPSLLGLDAAKQRARELHEKAIASLSRFDEAAHPLRQISEYIVTRRH